MTHDERYKKTGLTVSLGGAVVDTLTNATRTIKQAGGRDDKRLAALELNEARQQLQDGYAAVDKAIKGVKLRDADGKVLKDTKNHSRRGQKNIDDAVNLSVSIGGTSRKQGQVVDTNTYQGGTLVSDSEVQIKARGAEQSGIELTGEKVGAKKLVLDSASDINLAAGKNTVDVKNTYKSSGWSVGAGISLTGGGLLDINASGNMARQNGDTHQESYVPTTIKAAQLAQLKAKRDTTIIGSTVSGKKVEVDTGRDLHIQSLQDVDNFKEHSKSAGFSVSSKPNFKDPTGSISASVGRIDSKWKSVTHQAGIFAGEEGYTLNVGNGTTLEGAVIKSDAPKAKNTLTTKSLEMKDIQNEAEYTYSNNGIGYNYYGSKKKLEEMKTNDKKGYDKIYNSIGLVPNLGVGSKGKASSTTQSAISDGILTVDGKEIDTKTINTNTENTLHQLDKIFDKKKIEERQELARLFAKNAYEQLHNWQPTTKEGKIAKAFAHGVIGEWAARMAGNAPGSGFKATMTNELLIEKIKQIADNDPALAQWLSAAVGVVVNKVSGDSVNTGAAVASYATKWNDGTGVKSSLEEAYTAIDKDILEEINKQEYDDLNNLSKILIKGTQVGENSDRLASIFGRFSPNYNVAVAFYKHALHGNGEKQYFPLGTAASQLISNHSSFISKVKENSADMSVGESKVQYFVVSTHTNAKAAFGKIKIGVKMTKISEDKVHVVGQGKDLYNFEWISDYSNDIPDVPPVELSADFIAKLWSIVKGVSEESALIAANNIAYLEQRAGIIKPFKYGIQIDTVI